MSKQLFVDPYLSIDVIVNARIHKLGLAKGRKRWRRVTLGFSWEGAKEI
jgi:hypothetical protein